MIITKMNGYTVSALQEENRIVELDCERVELESVLNHIYIGKVKNIVQNINAAFIEFTDGKMGYYSLRENKFPYFINSKNTEKICQGDEILVQVAKDNIKTKDPVLTSNINLTGKYVVLTVGNNRLGFSGKITDEAWKKQLKAKINSYCTDEIGYIVRTNAKSATTDQIISEVEKLSSLWENLKETAKHRTCYSLVYKAPETYLCNIRDAYSDILTDIITDDSDLYNEMKQYLTIHQPEDLGKLSFYQDDLLPLYKLYSLEKVLQDALKERVWLKSGAYLVIQPTEAFVVIDVNTGKFIAKKKTRDTFLKINLEAAQEIGRQLRLRNLSGIVVVDFIDLEEEDKDYLMKSFRDILVKDPIRTTLVGLSQLNLAELTRKKVRKPLHEQLSFVCEECHGSGRIVPEFK